jgi:hypothetical protein
MKKLITLLSVPLFALTVNSCRDFSQDFCKYKEKGDLVIRALKEPIGNVLRITEKDQLNSPYHRGLTAVDNFPVNKNGILGDGRFDEIRLNEIPIGNELEKYARLDSITKIYNEVKETGCNCGEEYPSQEKINPFLSPFPYISDSTWNSLTKEKRDSLVRDYFQNKQGEKK